MKYQSIAVCVVAGLVLLAPRANAESDAGLWLEAGVQHKVNKQLRLSFDQHLRFQDNASEVESVMPELGANYRLHKRLRLGAGYRLAYKRTGSGDFEWRPRLHLEARVEHRIGKVELQYRPRFQDTLRGIDGADGSRYAIRNKLSLSRSIDKRTTPEVSVELFSAVGNGESVAKDKVRLTIGVTREFGKRDLDIYYRVEALHDDETEPVLHILGLGFQLPL